MNAQAFHTLSYGIYVLTSIKNNIPYGCIINTAFQITSKPARIAVSCNRDNFTHGIISESGVFGISVLPESASSDLIGTFGYKSGRDIDKFADVHWTSGTETDVPLLMEQCISTFECRVVEVLDVGTHTIFVGEVVNAEITDASSIEMTYRYYHKERKGVAPKNAPTYIEKETPMADSEIWVCDLCGYEFEAISGSEFEKLPADWVCPICGADKSMFTKK